MSVAVRINGVQEELESELTVAELVDRFLASPSGESEELADRKPRGIAVALNGEVVPRSSWNDTRVRNGDAIEIVGASQGG
jgi:sulfur carrier protein